MPNELPEADCFITLQEVADVINQFHISNANRQIKVTIILVALIAHRHLDFLIETTTAHVPF